MTFFANSASRLVTRAGTMLTIAALTLSPAAQAQYGGGGGGSGGFHGGGGGFHGGGGSHDGGYRAGGDGGGGWDCGYYGAPAIIFGTPYGYCTPPLVYGRDDYYGYGRRRCN